MAPAEVGLRLTGVDRITESLKGRMMESADLNQWRLSILMSFY